MTEWIILGIIAVWIVVAIIFTVRRKKSGKSCCGCSGCALKSKCNSKNKKG